MMYLPVTHTVHRRVQFWRLVLNFPPGDDEIFRFHRKHETGGFSLIELLVVVAILAILAAVAIPLFLNQKAKARSAAVRSDVHNAVLEGETLQHSYPTLPEGQTNLANAGLGSTNVSPKNYVFLYPNCSLTNATTAAYTPGEFVVFGQTGNAYSGSDGEEYAFDSKSGTWYVQPAAGTWSAVDAVSPCDGVAKRWQKNGGG